jgi:predicted Zn finger-like uncharacterized protein
MANVRVTCPTCKAELEIGEEHLGQEVECGSCLQPFVARASSGGSSRGRPRDDENRDRRRDDDRGRRRDEDRPSRRGRRRRDDSEDDFDYSPPGAEGGGGSVALGTVSLILSLISFPMIFCCCHLNVPVSLAALVCGIIGMAKPNGRGLSIAGVVISVLSLLTYGSLFLFGLGFNAMNFNNLKRGR